MIASVLASSNCLAQSTLEKAMKFTPKQPGVDIDTPTDLKGCDIQPVKTADGKEGWAVTNANGQLIRQFIDMNGDGPLDSMSYYKQGVVVYRDIDSNFDKKFDQYRWFGTAGMRWGVDPDQNGTIDSWKAISAEEVSFEVVEAIRTPDVERFNRLLISEDEVKKLGLGEEQEEEILERVGKAKTSFAAFARSQKLIGKKSKWIHFSGLIPGVIPSGTNGSKSDVTIYDSVAAVVNDGSRSSGQLSIGTLIRVGDSWRVVDLPEPIVEGQALTNGGLFFRNAGNLAANQIANNDVSGGVSAEDQKLFEQYEVLDKKIQATNSKTALQPLNAQRARLFAELIAGAKSKENRSNWVRQMADQVTASYQQGEYNDGISFMRDFINDNEGEDGFVEADMVYCKYRVINSYYTFKMSNATTDELEEAQNEFMGKLEQFVKAHPQDSNAADAMLQLALDDEAEGNINEAKDWYKQIVTNFPDSALISRARGATTRLNSEGKSIPLEGKSLDGRNFNLADRRGKVVLIQYWATWCEPCKNDLRLIKKAHEAFAKRGFEVVSVSLDSDVDDLKGYLRSNPLPWTHLFEEGGLDSPLSEQLGVAMVPTMLLVGADGKVIDRSVLAQDLDKILDRQFRRSANRDDK